MRTASRRSINPTSSLGSNPSTRLHKPTYGASGACACIPTSRSTASAAEHPHRSTNPCRTDVARPNPRLDSTSRGPDMARKYADHGFDPERGPSAVSGSG